MQSGGGRWAAVIMLFTGAVQAQNFQAGVDFLTGLPQREFRENVDDLGFGVSGEIGGFLGDSPVMIGGKFGFLNYGIERRWEPFSYAIPDVIVRVSTTNNILLAHAFVRLQPREGAVRPYVEGLVGLKYLFTRTSIDSDDWDDDTASYTNLDDLTPSYGVGAGVHVRLWQSRARRGHGNPAQLSLNLGARYLWGGDAEYLKKGSIWRQEGEVFYDIHRSTTDLLTPQVGISVRF
jgi:hypothetical protein